MAIDTVRLTLAEQAAGAGPCDLCAEPAEQTAVLVVHHQHGGQVRFGACARCTRALRRLLAALGTAAVDAAATIVDTAPPDSTHGSTVAGPANGPVELVRALEALVQDPGGTVYSAAVWGEPRADGTWAGRLVFTPAGDGSPRQTGRETTQPTRQALTYWATGLEPIYLEGALARATAGRGGAGAVPDGV